MTTFQAILYGILHGFTEMLPLGAEAHRILLAYVTGWPEPSGPLLGVLWLGSALALWIYFIHDWASMFSSLLRILVYRKKPMTFDERMPFFVLLATAPVAVFWYYLHEQISARLDASPLVVAVTLGSFGLLLGFADSMSRKTKNMYDWHVFDSIIMGFVQIAALIPGCGRGSAALTGALFRNFSRVAAAKFSFFTAAPLLTAGALFHLHGLNFHAPEPMAELSWLSFYVAFVVAFFSSLLFMSAFMKQFHRGGVRSYVTWRVLVAVAIGTLYFIRTRNSG